MTYAYVMTTPIWWLPEKTTGKWEIPHTAKLPDHTVADVERRGEKTEPLTSKA